MNTKRYYPRYAGKDGFEDRYEVVDSTAREAVSARMPYHQANTEADARNEGRDIAEHLQANGLGAWGAYLPVSGAAPNG